MRARSATARAKPHSPTRERSSGGSHRSTSRSAQTRAGAGKGGTGAAGRNARGQRRSRGLRKAEAPHRRRLVFLVASFLIVGALVVGVVSLQAVVSQGSFRMQELANHNLELQQEYGRLKLQVAELSSPGRIVKQARRLGFHLPGPEDLRPLPIKGGLRVGGGVGPVSHLAFSLKVLLRQRP